MLRLRNEVHQLTGRQRELAGERDENERLHAQVAARATNAPAADGLPPGYILRSKAQFLGYSTPEDTIQSVLWAMQNRDFTNLLQAMTPESAKKLQAQVQRPDYPSRNSSGMPDLFRCASSQPAAIARRLHRIEYGSGAGAGKGHTIPFPAN